MSNDSSPRRANVEFSRWHRPGLYHTIASLYLFLIGAAIFVIFFFIGTISGVYGIFFLPIAFMISIPAFVLGNMVLRGSKVGVIISMIALVGSSVWLGWYIITDLYQYNFSLTHYETVSPIPLMVLFAGNSVMFAFLVMGWKSLRIDPLGIKKQGKIGKVSIPVLTLAFFPVAIIAVFIYNYGADLLAGNGKFDSLTGVVVDRSGNIYASDTQTHRLLKFNSKGIFTSLWPWPSDAAHMAIGSDGFIYSVNGGVGISKYDTSGNKISTLGGASPTINAAGYRGVALDSKDDIFVIDASSKIIEFNAKGDFVTEWNLDKSPNGNLTLIDPASITVDSHDNIYSIVDVALWRHAYNGYESNGGVISKFKIMDSVSRCDPQNEVATNICFIKKWTALVSKGIAVDSHGYVYAGDEVTIAKFTTDGNFIRGFQGTSINGIGSFASLSDVTIDNNDNIYGADDGYWKRVVKLTSDGQLISEIGTSWHQKCIERCP